MRRARGFTLIEALVALSIFSFIGVACYQLLSSTGSLKESGEQRFRAVTGLQLAIRQLDEDFTQFSPRPIPLGREEYEPALDASPTDAVVSLTRAGWRNPLGLPRSGLQRVTWSVDADARLLRSFRRNLDDRDPDEVVERVFAEGIDEFSLRYMDDKGKWQDDWPPARSAATEATGAAATGEGASPGAPPAPATGRKPEPVPRAVEIRLVHRQIGEVTRVVPIR